MAVSRYGRLDKLVSSGVIRINMALVWIVSRLHIAPRGLEAVHNMLVKVAVSLTDGGRSGTSIICLAAAACV